ncbi:YebC/PmpR family DNA-binding transcriptional regulator [Teredinibacter waterburyi]|jgi:DNA-binding regulatory protein, YebC/PmpR family|uniref:YebC/PmpR family DNA-binding transcriptional regulator n=1 Tax=Teredinibacter waterburyi TaxID=1500538 RepID=UPI00165F26E9|nr:YebC/PmpR family DNA-binding transcriptional regulator [Teredinibacter waterburyi]
MGRTYENRKASMAKTGAMKTKLYSKFGKEIYVCAKNGGPEVDSNLSLRRLIEKAKKNQVPGNIIDKAIDKARGGGGEDFVTVRFEGFGPGNCMIIVDCLTDNNNRTFGDVRTCFNKAKAKIGAQGAVAHMFDHRAVFSFKHDDEDAVLEALMEDDVDVAEIENEDGIITVLAPHTEFYKTKTALADAFPELDIEVEEITFIPQTYAELNEEDTAMLDKLVDLLNDCDDVQEVYHNADAPS